MFGQQTLGTLVGLARSYLTFHVGRIHFNPIETCLLVLSASALVVCALHLWRIGQREDRVARLEVFRRASPATGATPPAQMTRFYHRVAKIMAGGPFIGAAQQERILGYLAEAGIKGQSSLAAVIAAKLGCAVGAAVLLWLFLEWRGYFVTRPLVASLLSVAMLPLGWLLPEFVVNRLAARRKVQMEQGIPDAIDLLVICAEAGLSLDQAIEQVAHEMKSSHPAVAEEFDATAAEMRVLPERGQALENLGRRSGLATLRSLIATLVQSIRFGTPLAESLRIIAAQMRAERMARFEERAARLPVILTVVMMIFVLPSLLMLIATPLIIRIGALMGALGRGHL